MGWTLGGFQASFIGMSANLDYAEKAFGESMRKCIEGQATMMMTGPDEEKAEAHKEEKQGG